jgi:hypothetical protein
MYVYISIHTHSLKGMCKKLINTVEENRMGKDTGNGKSYKDVGYKLK